MQLQSGLAAAVESAADNRPSLAVPFHEVEQSPNQPPARRFSKSCQGLEFHFGAYQVCEKWLKDRRKRVLSYDDIDHHRAAALARTIERMEGGDREIDARGGWPPH